MIIAVINGINAVFSLFYIIILVRCALSFIQGIDYRKQPFLVIRQITDPYLEIFRRVIPPIGMIDISPVVAIFVLGIIQRIIIYIMLYLAQGLS